MMRMMLRGIRLRLRVGVLTLFPGFDHLYLIKSGAETQNFFADFESDPPHLELLRGEWLPEGVLEAHWAMGKAEPQGIVWGTSTAWIYISPEVQKLFREHKVSGWETYPINLHNKAGTVCPGYAGLIISGRCGPIDKKRGDVVPGQRPGRKFVRRTGLYFDPSSWDETDLFCSVDSGHKFATERVKNLLEDHEMRGLEFTQLTEATWLHTAE